MNLQRTAFRVHRVMSYFVFAQVLAWVTGGVVFALLPFDGVVKGGAYVTKPEPVLSEGWAAAVAGPLSGLRGVKHVGAFASPWGPALRVRHEGGETRLRADGRALPDADSASVAAAARAIYRGPGALAEVRRVERAARRLGIVDETGGRRDLWRARFGDRLGTRLYFDGPSGEYLTVRNEAWVAYDFFWRLHIMDYGGGEDFNNLPLRVFAVSALGFALSGAVLTVSAARRAWRGRARAER